MMTLQLELKKVLLQVDDSNDVEPRTVLNIRGLPQSLVLAQGTQLAGLIIEILPEGSLRIKGFDHQVLFESWPKTEFGEGVLR